MFIKVFISVKESIRNQAFDIISLLGWSLYRRIFFLSTNQIKMQLDLQQKQHLLHEIEGKKRQKLRFIYRHGAKKWKQTTVYWSIRFVLTNIKWSKWFATQIPNTESKTKKYRAHTLNISLWLALSHFHHSPPPSTSFHIFLSFASYFTCYFYRCTHTLCVCRSCKLVWSKRTRW